MELVMTIIEASEKFGESKAHAFKIGGTNPSIWYFRLDEPKFMPPGSKYRCHVSCLKFDQESGVLNVTNLPIKDSYDINAFSIKEFVDQVLISVNKAITTNNISQLKSYENYGFYKAAETGNPLQEAKEILP